MSGYSYFAESIRAFAASDRESALKWARQAHEADPDETLYTDAVAYLAQAQVKLGLYGQADAFSAFIGGGGNLPLYDAARARLGEWLRTRQPASLLDIGTGEGSIIVPVAATLDPPPT